MAQLINVNQIYRYLPQCILFCIGGWMQDETCANSLLLGVSLCQSLDLFHHHFLIE